MLCAGCHGEPVTFLSSSSLDWCQDHTANKQHAGVRTLGFKGMMCVMAHLHGQFE